MVLSQQVSRGLTKVAAKHGAPPAGRLADASSPTAEASMSTMEAALEAWVECRPDGLTLPEAKLPQALPIVARYAADCRPSGADPQAMADLFSADGGDEPLFQRMLKVQDGRVQFLHFWRAFSKATQLLVGQSGGSGAQGEGLSLELETLRDSVLRLLDVASEESELKPNTAVLTAAKLIEALHVASAMSRTPNFWKSTEKSLGHLPKDCDLSRDEVTIILLQWLRSAVCWRERVDTEEDLSIRGATEKGMPVFIHIYDVSKEDAVHKTNKWLANKNSPLKFGGIFHAGIEVNGLEWSYGMTLSETMSGIQCHEPRQHPAHRYRQTVRLKNSQMSPEDAAELISQLLEEYPGDDYHLLRRNCCHFADDFSRRLGSGKIPRWVHRLARVGARLDGFMQAVSGRSLLGDLQMVADSSDDSD